MKGGFLKDNTPEPQKSRRNQYLAHLIDDFVESLLFDKVLVVVCRLGGVVLLVGIALWVSVLCVELFNFSMNTKNVR